MLSQNFVSLGAKATIRRIRKYFIAGKLPLGYQIATIAVSLYKRLGTMSHNLFYFYVHSLEAFKYVPDDQVTESKLFSFRALTDITREQEIC